MRGPRSSHPPDHLQLEAGVDPVGGRRVIGPAVGDVPRHPEASLTSLASWWNEDRISKFILSFQVFKTIDFAIFCP